MIVLFGAILAEIAMVYFTLTVSSSNRQNYKDAATDLSKTVAVTVNKDDVASLTKYIVDIYNEYPDNDKPTREKENTPMFKEYLAKVQTVKTMPYYLSLQTFLHSVKGANADTDGIYLGYVDLKNKLTVYLVYDQENEVYPVGMVDLLYEEDYPMIDNPSIGFVASIYESELDGGTLVTAGSPIYDKDGNIMCYALVDITMNVVRSKQAGSIVNLFIYLAATVFVLCILGIIIVNFTLVKPVKALENAANSYDANNPEDTHAKFNQLKVNTNDEYADLAEKMKKMENDIFDKIRALDRSHKLNSDLRALANKDALTGVRNKTAYDKAVEIIDKKIKDDVDVEFAVAMVDLNYLKNINDEYGHACGDTALIRLCNLVCGIFVHSPVYRYGGDEFIVLLRNRDYRNIDKLIDEFNDKLAELSEDHELLPYEKISAAIGYSKYDPKNDSSVMDVFKRADKNMYTRKREMKANKQ